MSVAVKVIELGTLALHSFRLLCKKAPIVRYIEV
jgi:hypothetical protein